jgi:hypothetical protein
MRIAGESVSRGGALSVALAGAAALLLAIHGYSNPGSLRIAGSGLVSPTHGGPQSGGTGGSATASPSPAVTPAASPSGTATLGPLLSSTPYAAYSYQIYPGTPTVSARQAMAGFSFSARLAGDSVDFTLYVSGGGQPPVSNTYPASDHIYFIEANMGDDSGTAEYNFGDDGVVVTDASGHVVR